MALRQLASVDDALAWFAQRGVRALQVDSRQVGPGDAFLAWPGHTVDGRAFVPQALAAGAHACLVDADGAPAFDALAPDALAALPDLKGQVGPLASRFLGAPSERLEVLAVTGTNGKTSTAWWLAQGLSALGRRCGVIGTLGVGEPPTRAQASSLSFTGMTTPDAVTVQAGFQRFADAGFAACAIEATSIGLAEHRLDGTAIDIALFTNLTQDHLDYHGAMQAYRDAKARLFDWPGLRAAVVNLDDAQGAALADTLQHRPLELWTYSSRAAARLRASAIGYRFGGLCFDLHEGAATIAVSTGLIGDYNVANLLAAIGGLRACGVALADAAAVCTQMTPVPGRMERVGLDAPGPQVVVDYAHTPDALEQALRALQPFAADRGGQLWCVFGCGGNRDQGKRPLMGALAQRLAQRVVVTSDNPRNEAPDLILRQIVAGMDGAGVDPPMNRTPSGPVDADGRVNVIDDRRAAIAHALRAAGARDVVLIAGKGHEDYQEIAGVKQHFSDVEEARAALAARTGAAA